MFNIHFAHSSQVLKWRKFVLKNDGERIKMQKRPLYKSGNIAGNTTGNLPRSNLEGKDVDFLPSLEVKWKESVVQSTKDPKVFGPPLWFSIHNSAAHYPISPSPLCQQHVMSFIKTIPYLVPCEECFLHAQSYITQFSDSDLLEITKTRATYFEWSVNFHNFVNKRIGKREVSLQDAYNMFHNTPKVKLLSFS